MSVVDRLKKQYQPSKPAPQAPVKSTQIAPRGQAPKYQAPAGGKQISENKFQTPSGSIWEYKPDGTRTVHLAPQFGGGSYDINPNKPGGLVKAPEKGFAGVPAKTGQERDHIVPHALGGSSEYRTNIRPVPASENNKANWEVDIINKYKGGALSLGEARAQIMGKKSSVGEPQGTFANFRGALEEKLPNVSDLIQKIKGDPLSISKVKPETTKSGVPIPVPFTIAKNTAPAIWNSIKDPVLAMGPRIKDYFDKTVNPLSKATPAEKIASQLNLVSGGASVGLSPLSALFEGANEVPILGTVSKLIMLPISTVGDASGSTSEFLINKLPISQESKDQLVPAVKEIATLAGMFLAGKGGHVASKGVTPKKFQELEAKYGTQDATTIVRKAQDIAFKEEQKQAVELFDKVNGFIPEAVQKPKGVTLLHGGPSELKGGKLNTGMGIGGNDAGAIFFSPDTPTGKMYARGYSLKGSTKPGGGAIHKVELSPDAKIFDASNPKDIKQLSKFAQREIIDDIQSTARNGTMDWATGSQYFEEIRAAGFDGAKLSERPAGFDLFDENGKLVKSPEDAHSIAIFDNKHFEMLPDSKITDTYLKPEENPLITEARKYKSAEEFVNAMKTKDWRKSMSEDEYSRFAIQWQKDVNSSGKSIEANITDIWNKANEVKKPRTVVKEEKPVSKEFQSRVFDRMKAENPEVLSGDLKVQEMNMKQDFDRSVELIKKNKQEAYEIAMNKKSSPDVTSTSVNIALSELALKAGKNDLYAELITNRSLEQTRRGQEIVAEKGSIKDNSTARYVKELIASRLQNLGSDYLSNLKDPLKRKSAKEKATAKIDSEVSKLETKIKDKKLDTKTALALLDKLTCI